MFRDRWGCGHIGTVIFAVQGGALVPCIIGVMGGGTALSAITTGGAIVAGVVMSYVFFGGMRVHMGERVPGGAVPVVWRDRARGNRPRHGRVSRCDTSAACLAGHRAASDAGAILAAVLPQLHVYPALDDRVPAHHDFCLTARRMAQFRAR